MDPLFVMAALLLCGVLVTMIAMPEKFIPDHPLGKKKKVGSSSWGVYNGADPETIVGTVEVTPLVGKHKSIYGASAYNSGRPVSRKGA